MFTLYTTEDKLTELCLEGEEWFDIIRNQPTIYVCNESDNAEWDVTNATLVALHRSGTSIEVDNEVIDAKEVNEKKVSTKSNDQGRAYEYAWIQTLYKALAGLRETRIVDYAK